MISYPHPQRFHVQWNIASLRDFFRVVHIGCFSMVRLFHAVNAISNRGQMEATKRSSPVTANGSNRAYPSDTTGFLNESEVRIDLLR